MPNHVQYMKDLFPKSTSETSFGEETCNMCMARAKMPHKELLLLFYFYWEEAIQKRRLILSILAFYDHGKMPLLNLLVRVSAHSLQGVEWLRLHSGDILHD